MTDVLTHIEHTLHLAKDWEKEAELFERRNPTSEAARVLRQCSTDLRKAADEAAPEWVPLSVVRDRTGWSESWLADRVLDLVEIGKARKEGRVWMIERGAALDIPMKREPVVIASAKSVEDLADRILALQRAS